MEAPSSPARHEVVELIRLLTMAPASVSLRHESATVSPATE
jgi:hypothetical protein